MNKSSIVKLCLAAITLSIIIVNFHFHERNSAVLNSTVSKQEFSITSFLTTATTSAIKAATNHLGSEPVRHVYLDWSANSDLFGYWNYKCFESLLTHYGDASITVLLPGPYAADYYKFGALLR